MFAGSLTAAADDPSNEEGEEEEELELVVTRLCCKGTSCKKTNSWSGLFKITFPVKPKNENCDRIVACSDMDKDDPNEWTVNFQLGLFCDEEEGG